MSDFVSLYSALSGLHAAQAAMDTASHNVANVATPGYTRQRVELAARAPYDALFGRVGSGVDITDISRARDAFLDGRARAGAAGLGSLRARTELLERAELALAEPSNGPAAALDEVWAAFEELGLDPTSDAARRHVLDSLDSLAARIRALTTEWATLAGDAAASLADDVAATNELAVQVAALNEAIVAAGTGPGAPNDLLDRRDTALDRMSELAGVVVTVAGDGTARVSIDGMALVSGVSARQITVGAGSTLQVSGADVAPGGELAGRQTFLTADLPGFEAELDAFVVELSAALNGAHSAGFSSATTPGGPLFTYTPGAAAATIALAVTDPADLAAASSAGPPFPAFDGSNASAIADLRTAQVAAGGTLTLGAAWRGVTSGIGGAAASSRAAAESQDALLATTELARQSAHGVSLDEEMANLLRFQRSYEAASRVLTAVDETLDVLVNRTGVVGR